MSQSVVPSMTEARRSVTLTYSRYNRRRKAGFAVDFARHRGVRSVLLVGVSQTWAAHLNVVETALIDAGLDVTASGLGRDSEGWTKYLVADGCHLPFPDKSFDLVYSNAVIEHVGQAAEQQRFVEEHARVGRHWILTTPNKWFPVEAHTDQLFRHWSPGWGDPKVSRLLSLPTLRQLLPAGSRVVGLPVSPTLTAASD